MKKGKRLDMEENVLQSWIDTVSYEELVMYYKDIQEDYLKKVSDEELLELLELV